MEDKRRKPVEASLPISGRILIAEDETEVADLLELYLSKEGYHVIKCPDGLSAWEQMEKEEVDLAILDVMMPGLDGFALCRKIRERYLFPVIMLTAKVEDVDKISGLMQGADDYITKPFNPLEVIARVKSQLRRYRAYNPRQEEELDLRGLSISRSTHLCMLYGRKLELTPREFDILWYLCENRGRVVSSEELFETVWGEKYLDSNNTVMNHIGKLREKMQESYKNPRFIKTVWGIGYTVEA
jgi:two-component system response regulator VanR